ncbi:MAG TPA: PIN domain-containing protein [Terracidiphilus sp.]|nr:PIN domain-containing protein [Terracidiphilus sp.]
MSSSKWSSIPAGASGTYPCFLDTNVLLYCDDSGSQAKQRRALEIVLEHRSKGTGVVSLQVLQEYFANSTRKLGLDPDLARQKVEVYARFRVVEPSVTDLLAAIDLYRLHKLSIWDALIVNSAKQSGCRVLLTEDMQHGQAIGGVRIVNPFI